MSTNSQVFSGPHYFFMKDPKNTSRYQRVITLVLMSEQGIFTIKESHFSNGEKVSVSERDNENLERALSDLTKWTETFQSMGYEQSVNTNQPNFLDEIINKTKEIQEFEKPSVVDSASKCKLAKEIAKKRLGNAYKASLKYRRQNCMRLKYKRQNCIRMPTKKVHKSIIAKPSKGGDKLNWIDFMDMLVDEKALTKAKYGRITEGNITRSLRLSV